MRDLLEVTTQLAPRPVRLVRIERENYRVATFTFDLSVSVQPGQFGMFWLPGQDEKPFSLVDGAPLAITVAAVGPFTRALHALEPGALVGFRGPFGTPFTPKGATLLLAGGGYGVAPLFFLAREALKAGRRVTMVTGARTADDLLLVRRVEDVGCPVVVMTEDGSAGERGLASMAVAGLLETDRPDAVCGCGPEGLLVALAHLAREHGLPAQLSVERLFKCAIGICGHCAVGQWLACIDGPVLDSVKLLAEEEFGRWHRLQSGALVPLGHGTPEPSPSPHC